MNNMQPVPDRYSPLIMTYSKAGLAIHGPKNQTKPNPETKYIYPISGNHIIQ